MLMVLLSVESVQSLEVMTLNFSSTPVILVMLF